MNKKPDAAEHSGSTDCSLSSQGEPESQEMFDDEFSIGELDAASIAERIDEMMEGLHRDAGDLVRRWFLQHRYVNVSAASFVDHDRDADIIMCKVVVSCWGLPERRLSDGMAMLCRKSGMRKKSRG